MKIVYCIVDCSLSGGTERVVCSKANYLANKLRYDVTIITTDQYDRPNFYLFSNKIRFIDIGINYNELHSYPFFERIIVQMKKRKKHRQKLSEILTKIKADIVVSTYTHEFTLLPSIKDGSRKIGEIHFSKEYNRIENKYKKQSFLSKVASLLAEKRKHLFIRRYDKFVALTREDLKNWRNLPNITQIYNPLPFYIDSSSTLERKRIISIGRLSLQKSFDRLIEAFCLVHAEFPDWQLDIFGTGEKEKQLRSLIKNYGLENVIKINRPTQDIIKEYLESSIYVMTSLYEGFGLALTEAMSCGVPCISFDCPSGPSEIINDGENGFLVEDGNITQLSKKIKILIHNSELRKEMGKKAKKDVLRFSPDTIMNEWINLFNELIKNENPPNQ